MTRLRSILYNEPQETLAHVGAEVSRNVLRSICSDRNIPAREVDIFLALHQWGQANCAEEQYDNIAPREAIRNVIGDLLFEIRFNLMTPEEFAKRVVTTDLLENEELLEILRYFNADPKPAIRFRTEERGKMTF